MSNFTDFIGGSGGGGGTFSDEYVQKTVTAGSNLSVGDKVLLTDSNTAVASNANLSTLGSNSFESTHKYGNFRGVRVLSNGAHLYLNTSTTSTSNVGYFVIVAKSVDGTHSGSGYVGTNTAPQYFNAELCEIENVNGTVRAVAFVGTEYSGTKYATLVHFSVSPTCQVTIHDKEYLTSTRNLTGSVAGNNIMVMSSDTANNFLQIWQIQPNNTLVRILNASRSTYFGANVYGVKFYKLNDSDDRYIAVATDNSSIKVSVLSIVGTTVTPLSNNSFTFASSAYPEVGTFAFKVSNDEVQLRTSNTSFENNGSYLSSTVSVNASNVISLTENGYSTFTGYTHYAKYQALAGLYCDFTFSYNLEIPNDKVVVHGASYGAMLVFDIQADEFKLTKEFVPDGYVTTNYRYDYGYLGYGVGANGEFFIASDDDSSQVQNWRNSTGNEMHSVSYGLDLFLGNSIKVTEVVGYSNSDASSGEAITVSVKKGMPEAYGIPAGSFIQYGDDYYPVDSEVSFGVSGGSGSSIKSIQQVSFSGSNYGTATISPVDTAKSTVILRSSIGNKSYDLTVTLSSETEVYFHVGGGYSFSGSATIVEYN